MELPPNSLPVPEDAVLLTSEERVRVQKYLNMIAEAHRMANSARSCLDDILDTIGERAGLGTSPRLSADLSFIRKKEMIHGK